MKKLILVSMLVLGMLTFAERFTSPNKTLELSLKEDAGEVSSEGYFWYNEEGDADKYSFHIVIESKKEMSLVQSYESRENLSTFCAELTDFEILRVIRGFTYFSVLANIA